MLAAADNIIPATSRTAAATAALLTPVRGLRLHCIDPEPDPCLATALHNRKLPPSFLKDDDRGYRLFTQLCAHRDYYLQQAEQSVISANRREIQEVLEYSREVIDFGGSAILQEANRQLLLPRVRHHMALDWCRPRLQASFLSSRRTDLPCSCITSANSFSNFSVPAQPHVKSRAITIGYQAFSELSHTQAEAYLSKVAEFAAPYAPILVSIDLIKDRRLLEEAYNDSGGCAARWNRHALRRLNQQTGSNLPQAQFHHSAFWNAHESRVEMHLVSLESCKVQLNEDIITFAPGESLHTASFYRHSLSGFAALAGRAGLEVKHAWTDPRGLFTIQHLVRRG